MFRTTLLVTVLSLVAGPARAPSPDWVRHVLANFDRIDANGDGLISRAEFRDVQAARWRQIDRNGDGNLGTDDFPSGSVRRARARLAEIAYLDENDDGRISEGEFLNAPALVFAQADRNADGVLTPSEIGLPAS